ncbi:MAG: thioesterase family protein [Pseudomonadota bacterium]|nr:thioesterase family protein [Pseudomonadota bacterium]
MTFNRTRRIRFSECDPAGIVFYPQYFVLFNDLLEEWVDSFWPRGFADYIVHSRFGLPTVRMEADFKAISRIGDDVILALGVNKIGRRSFELALTCTGAADDEVRISARQSIVTTSLDTHRATPIPAQLREALNRLASPARADADARALSQTSANR